MPVADNPFNSFTRNYQVDDNRMTELSVGMTSFTLSYDVCGNLIQENSERNFGWDYGDKMKLFFNQTHSGVEPTIYTQYLYDSSGNRVKKFTRTSGGNWETLTYIDGIIEYRENDVSERQSIAFVMDDTRRVVSLREGDDFGDTTPALKYQLDDHLGSSNLLVEADGTLVSREEYYPFGETSFGSYGKKRYRFCGKERDEESGMYYYGARYYAPWTCRFVSVDPLAGKYPFYTPYQYAGNQPINFIDLDGKEQAQPQSPGGTGAPPTPPVNNVVPRDATTATMGPPPDPTTLKPIERITFSEAASLADNVYGGPSVAQPKGGFVKAESKMAELIKQGVVFNDPNTGLNSALYERTINGKTEYAYVFTGSEKGDAKDWIEDANQSLGKASPQYEQAARYAGIASRELGVENVAFVGHSLGGGLASAAAMAVGGRAITFNAAGLHRNTIKSYELNKSAKIDAYIVQGEIVETLQSIQGLKAAGTPHVLPASYVPLRGAVTW